jgi:hypothetical protein
MFFSLDFNKKNKKRGRRGMAGLPFHTCRVLGGSAGAPSE